MILCISDFEATFILITAVNILTDIKLVWVIQWFYDPKNIETLDGTPLWKVNDNR